MAIKKLYMVDVESENKSEIHLTKKDALESVKKHRAIHGKNEVVLMVFERVV